RPRLAERHRGEGGPGGLRRRPLGGPARPGRCPRRGRVRQRRPPRPPARARAARPRLPRRGRRPRAGLRPLSNSPPPPRTLPPASRGGIFGRGLCAPGLPRGGGARPRLLSAPYGAPPCGVGDRLVCERDGESVVAEMSGGPIPWPVCRAPGRPRLILCGDLAR